MDRHTALLGLTTMAATCTACCILGLVVAIYLGEIRKDSGNAVIFSSTATKAGFVGVFLWVLVFALQAA